MKRLQHIVELAPLLKGFGLRHVIICPGSRNAPLIQLFTSRKNFFCHSLVDERSAGYVALGMARQLKEPVAVLTTSGTAVLNLAPAVAEAYHQQIPLFVITADRPSEKIRHFNNQIIDQRAPFYNFSKAYYQLPMLSQPEDLDNALSHMERLFGEGLSYPAGPVHLNVLLEEPLYEPLPEPGKEKAAREKNSEKQDIKAEAGVGLRDFSTVENNTKILVLAGMGYYCENIIRNLEKLLKLGQLVVVAENIANLSADDFISGPELVLADLDEEGQKTLAPDLLLSFGGQVVSKRLKLFLQALPELKHMDIDSDVSANLEELAEHLAGVQGASSSNHFQELWKQKEAGRAGLMAEKVRDLPYGNLYITRALLSAAPSRSVIHLGSSSSVRYAQILPHRADLFYYANRGTSGIDGCVSAAVGAAMVSEDLHILLVGDLSFVYDSNALWNRAFPENLKIVVLNDRGGGIFRLLKGPSEMDFFEDFSVAYHPVSPEKLAYSFQRKALRVKNQHELEEALSLLFAPDSSLSVVDADSSMQENSRIFKAFLDFKHK